MRAAVISAMKILLLITPEMEARTLINVTEDTIGLAFEKSYKKSTIR